MKRLRNAFGISVACVLLIAISLTSLSQRTKAQNTNPTQFEINGFKIEQVRLDTTEGVKPMPKIPKQLKFMGVSNGAASNSNILWFQDPKSNIYLLRGFTSTTNYKENKTGDYVIKDTIQMIGSQ